MHNKPDVQELFTARVCPAHKVLSPSGRLQESIANDHCVTACWCAGLPQ